MENINRFRVPPKARLAKGGRHGMTLNEMKNYLLHGDNHPASRKNLSEIINAARTKGAGIVQIEWKSSKKAELLQAAQSQGMFSSLQLLVVENIFTNNKEALEIVNGIEKGGSSLVFWEGKTIPPSIISKLSKTFQVFEFKLPVLTFKFLDSIYPRNSKTSLDYLEKMEDQEADFLLIMLSRHIRFLIWVKEDPGTMKVAVWQKGNLEKQAAKFSTEQLYELHGKLLELDRLNKKSQLIGSLMENLEVLISTL